MKTSVKVNVLVEKDEDYRFMELYPKASGRDLDTVILDELIKLETSGYRIVEVMDHTALNRHLSGKEEKQGSFKVHSLKEVSGDNWFAENAYFQRLYDELSAKVENTDQSKK